MNQSDYEISYLLEKLVQKEILTMREYRIIRHKSLEKAMRDFREEIKKIQE